MRNPASFAALTTRLYRDFHILIESCEHLDRFFHRNFLVIERALPASTNQPAAGPG
jgi:hypothetical protein